RPRSYRNRRWPGRHRATASSADSCALGYTIGMAKRHLSVAENAPGDLFVDSSCIECDTCRELAPDVYGSTASGQSFVLEQPRDDAAWRSVENAVARYNISLLGSDQRVELRECRLYVMVRQCGRERN